MKPIASRPCNVNGIFYNKGDEIDVTTKKGLIKLNEKGFIEPLTAIDIQNWSFKEDEPIKKTIIKKEGK